MGQSQTLQKCNFEDIQDIFLTNRENKYILINTLPTDEQYCLIKNTISYNNEETIINKYLNTQMKIIIFIYGRNTNDNTVVTKYQQLISLGFTNIYIYSGGLFEWLCLQDIYGIDNFPTSGEELDILKYKPLSNTKKNLIKDIDF